MKSNITLKLDAKLLREAKIVAAQRGTSVSRLLTRQLEEVIRKDKAYEAAKRRALTRLQKGYNLRWRPPATRDELHER